MKTGRKKPSGLLVNITLGLICLIWLIPTIGLLISSFRTRDDVSPQLDGGRSFPTGNGSQFKQLHLQKISIATSQ